MLVVTLKPFQATPKAQKTLNAYRGKHPYLKISVRRDNGRIAVHDFHLTRTPFFKWLNERLAVISIFNLFKV